MSILCAHTCTFMNTLLQSMLTLSARMSTYKEHVHSDILVSRCTKYVHTHELNMTILRTCVHTDRQGSTL